MAEAIVSCDGAGQNWTDVEGSPTCPSCELTAKDLGIRVRNTSKGLVPATIPQHEIIVEGTELRFATFADEYRVHAPECPGLKRDLTESGEKRAGTIVAADRDDAVALLWADEETGEVPDGAASATKFHARCVNRLDGFAPAKTAKSGSAKRDAKRELATGAILALAAYFAELPDDSAIFASLTRAEAGQTMANWVHHLPANREIWAESDLPTPERSDWKQDEQEPTPAEDESEDESEDEDSDEE